MVPVAQVQEAGRGTRTTVADVMTRRVVAVRVAADYKEIVLALRRYRVSACPVIDDAGRVIGVVSEADLLYKLAGPELPADLMRLSWRPHERSRAAAVTAGELMTSPAVAIAPDALVADAARTMQRKQVKRLPVIDTEGRLVGIVTRSDVLSVFERRDRDIRAEVSTVLLDPELALDPAVITVAVNAGVVTVTGQVDRRETARGLVARIRHTQGVVSVRDRLTYPR